jgi:hypothetical protein
MTVRKRLSSALNVFLVLWACGQAAGCAPVHRDPAPPPSDAVLRAEPWPEAGRNFRSDPRWLGGDGASSVDLGNGRVLWLFGDTFVDPRGSGDRHRAEIVRNTVAIQTGPDPARADIAFFWGQGPAGVPDAFFPHAGPDWYWPGDGILIERHVVVFLMTVGPAENELKFAAVGWAAVIIDNPEASPPAWHLRALQAPENRFGIVVGSASVLRSGEFVYAFGARPETRDVFLARWPARSFAQGDLSDMEWWTGDTAGWVPDAGLLAGSKKGPEPVFSDGQMEFTVEFVPARNRWLQVQTQSFLEPFLAARWAEHLTGPWSAMQDFYRPEALGRPGLLLYAGKSHPECTGAPFVFTYAVNSLDPDTLLRDKGIYYPEFLKGVLHAPGAPAVP